MNISFTLLISYESETCMFHLPLTFPTLLFFSFSTCSHEHHTNIEGLQWDRKDMLSTRNIETILFTWRDMIGGPLNTQRDTYRLADAQCFMCVYSEWLCFRNDYYSSLNEINIPANFISIMKEDRGVSLNVGRCIPCRWRNDARAGGTPPLSLLIKLCCCSQITRVTRWAGSLRALSSKFHHSFLTFLSDFIMRFWDILSDTKTFLDQ